MDTDSEFTKALQHHQSGQLRKAKEGYEKIIEVDPNPSDSLHLLGVIARQAGKGNRAVNLITKAIQNHPENPVYCNNLGNAFLGQSKPDEAVSCYQKALKLKLDYAKAYNNMGNVFQGQGKVACSAYIPGMNLRFFVTPMERMIEVLAGHEYVKIAINSLTCEA